MKELNILREDAKTFEGIAEKVDNALLALEILKTEEDKAISAELDENIKEIDQEINILEEKTLFREKYDAYPAILTIHPGAGGTESQDWAEMLFKMYARWMDKKGFRYRVNDYQVGEEAGIKNAIITLDSDYAYGFLKSEKGIHRLVRISPFDSSKRRHTSFASVDVIPLIKKDADIEINKDDLKIDTYRSSGAGGQHVNVTDSAVRITHLPTNTVVSCQDERSQLLNRQSAMQILRSKLFEIEMQKKKAEIEGIRGVKKEISWGNQIRSYVLAPYQLIKDHRTDHEIGDVLSVLNGDIDELIKKYLEWTFHN